MAEAKRNLFGSELARLAGTARALGHPARIRILKVLADRGGCFCGEIVDLLPLSQSTVSQHLMTLKRAGLIHAEVEGHKTYYCLDLIAVTKALRDLSGLFNSICVSAKHRGDVS